jgi:hypothetical protein
MCGAIEPFQQGSPEPDRCTYFPHASATVFVLTGRTLQPELNRHFEILHKENLCLSLEEDLQRPAPPRFQPPAENLNADLSTGAVRVMAALQNCESAPIKGKLETAPSYINEITLYLDHEDCIASLILLEKSGIVILFSRRKSKIRRCMFGLILDTPGWYVVCLHFRFTNQINIPVSIWQLISFVERNEICTLPLGSCCKFFLVKWLLNFMPF